MRVCFTPKPFVFLFYFATRSSQPLSGCACHPRFSDPPCSQRSASALVSCALVPPEVCSWTLSLWVLLQCMHAYHGLTRVGAVSSLRSLKLQVRYVQREHMYVSSCRRTIDHLCHAPPMPFHFFFANIGYAILCWIYALAGSNRSALYFSPPEEETPQTLPARRYRSTSCVLKCSFPSTTSDPCFGRCYCVSGRRPQLASLTPRCNDFTEQVVFDTDLQ